MHMCMCLITISQNLGARACQHQRPQKNFLYLRSCVYSTSSLSSAAQLTTGVLSFEVIFKYPVEISRATGSRSHCLILECGYLAAKASTQQHRLRVKRENSPGFIEKAALKRVVNGCALNRSDHINKNRKPSQK